MLGRMEYGLSRTHCQRVVVQWSKVDSDLIGNSSETWVTKLTSQLWSFVGLIPTLWPANTVAEFPAIEADSPRTSSR
jgi:hypothetical protein